VIVVTFCLTWSGAVLTPGSESVNWCSAEVAAAGFLAVECGVVVEDPAKSMKSATSAGFSF
jgi:hypothetical protein